MSPSASPPVRSSLPTRRSPSRSRALGRLVLAAAVAAGGALVVGAVTAVSPVAAAETVGFTPIELARDIDTRVGRGGPALEAGVERFLSLPSVPGDATAVLANVTVVDPVGAGHLNVTDCAAGASSSAVNFVAGRATPNAVVVGLGHRSGGDGICVMASASTHLLVDVFAVESSNGTGAFVPTSARERDTRSDGGVGPSRVVTVDVGRHGGDGSLLAWTGTVTGTNVARAGYVTAHACASPRPDVSNLNLTPGVTSANLVTIPLPRHDPRVCFFVDSEADLVVDTVGVWRPDRGQTFTAMSPPVRTIDTRGGSPLATDEIRRLHAPADGLLFVNVTATQARGQGWLAVFPCDHGARGTSTLNVMPGEDVAVGTVVNAAHGGVCITGSVTTHIVLDVYGVQHRAGVLVPVPSDVPVTGTVLRTGTADTGGVVIGPCQRGSTAGTDQTRRAAGLPALVADQRTDAFACEWALAMATSGQMTHSTSQQRSVVDACGVTGETIARSTRGPDGMVDAWLASPGHFAVITSPLLTRASFAHVERTEDGRSTWFGVMVLGGAC